MGTRHGGRWFLQWWNSQNGIPLHPMFFFMMQKFGFLWLINAKSPWEKRGADGRSNRINESYTDFVGWPVPWLGVVQSITGWCFRWTASDLLAFDLRLCWHGNNGFFWFARSKSRLILQTKPISSLSLSAHGLEPMCFATQDTTDRWQGMIYSPVSCRNVGC